MVKCVAINLDQWFPTGGMRTTGIQCGGIHGGTQEDVARKKYLLEKIYRLSLIHI